MEPIGIDLERDDLSFYPLLYWPMDPRQKALSARALARVSDYVRQGGTILFDTRDLSIGSAGRRPGNPAPPDAPDWTFRRWNASPAITS